MKKDQKILVSKNGPYLISGSLPLAKEIIGTNNKGESIKWIKGESYPEKESYALCRCGHSKTKPYCDGTHSKIGFDGTETASKKKYLEQAQKISGQGIDLTDAEAFCASGRFCDRLSGVWNLTENSGDSKAKEIAIQQACDCPSGRLVVWDKKTGKPIEPEFKPSISLIEDPPAKVSGPIWIKGGVTIESSDGTKHETRNRVTLCRCGQSSNKPFCDTTHISIRFSDGDKSLKIE